jgi:hypothetical protein
LFVKENLCPSVILGLSLLLFFGCALWNDAIKSGRSIATQQRTVLAPVVSLERGIETLSRDILESLASEKHPKIAVVDLLGPNDDHTQLGSLIAEKLITKLFISGRFEKVLERRLLRHLLMQQRIEMERYFDPGTVRSICGKIGVDGLVMGFITDCGSRVDVNVRLIDTRGEILAVGEVQIDKDQAIDGMLQSVKRATLAMAINPPTARALVAVGDRVARSMDGIALLKDIPQGIRSITITARGYETSQESIYLNGDRGVMIQLIPKRANLILRIDPVHSEIVLDGQPRGKATQGVMILKDLLPGKHTLLVRAAGYCPEAKQIALYEDTSMSIRLEPKPSLKEAPTDDQREAGGRGETIQHRTHQANETPQHSQTGIWDEEDEWGNRATLYKAGGDSEEKKRGEQEKVDRAWEMLRNVIIDTRENDERPYSDR